MILGGKKLLNIKRLFRFSLQLLSETFFVLRRLERNMIKNICWSSRKVAVIIVRFWRDLNFVETFSKNIHISHSMKIRPVGAELFYAEGRTDKQIGQTERS